MDQEQKLKEMIQAALSKPLSEKKKSFPDLTGDGKVTKADILKARGVIDEYESDADLIADEPISEDMDLGHEDDEPHMIKGELYKIAQNAIALYKMLAPFDKLEQEVDLPAWWQSKITKACTMLGSAKSYLEFELKEPQIDNMVNLTSATAETIDESPNTPKHIIVRQWVGPNSDFYLANKKEEYWDDKDYDVFNRLWKMVGDKGKIPSNLEEKMSKKQVKKRGEIYDALKDKGMSDEKAGRIATSKAQKIKEAVLAKLKEKK
jgi:hypothetical protein